MDSNIKLSWWMAFGNLTTDPRRTCTLARTCVANRSKEMYVSRARPLKGKIKEEHVAKFCPSPLL